jgi:hypothetical protein
MIATLKQHYECYHAGDLRALKKLYEYHAENCAKAAKLTEDTQQREEYLELAREWTEAARCALGVESKAVGAAQGQPHGVACECAEVVDQIGVSGVVRKMRTC